MSQMTLSRALRYKKRLVEKIRKCESDIQTNNSHLAENTPEVDVQGTYTNRQKLVAQLVALKMALQQATAPIMNLILELAETKSEIVFWQRVDTTFGMQRDRWSEVAPTEYVATYRKSWTDAKVVELQDKIDQLQTQIDAFNNETTISFTEAE